MNSPTAQLLRVQNFMLSTDGYGTGEGQSFERPFGHADPAVLARSERSGTDGSASCTAVCGTIVSTTNTLPGLTEPTPTSTKSNKPLDISEPGVCKRPPRQTTRREVRLDVA